jgi:DNA-binding LacI/PurR family transcriptional regulator
MRDKLVVAKGRAGTFVAEFPPHLFRYVLVLPNYGPLGGYHTALVREAERITREGPRIVDVAYGVDGRSDRPEFQTLLEDMRSGRLAGLIFPHSPYQIANTPLLIEPSLPRVAMTTGGPPGTIKIHLDFESFFIRGIRRLAERGRRRIALVGAFGPSFNHLLLVDRELEKHGMTMPPYWRIFVTPFSPEANRTIVHLLMHGPANERPDALLVTDDNLLESVTAGVIDAGVPVPRDLEIVALCNHPWPTPGLLPVTRLGYNIRALMNRCIDLIDTQRRTRKRPSGATVGAVFEDELDPGDLPAPPLIAGSPGLGNPNSPPH